MSDDAPTRRAARLKFLESPTVVVPASEQATRDKSPGGPRRSGVPESLEDAVASRYKDAVHLDQGGMGVILRAHHVGTNREVAVKVVRSDRDMSEAQIEKFVAEAQITAQLEHPNIVPVHDVSVTSEGELFFTMKLVRGDSLAAVIEQAAHHPEAWPLTRLLNLMLKVCDGVAFAHARGVVHRDLKPANIMIGEFGEVLVMDWGLAKVLGQHDPAVDSVTVSSQALASPTSEPLQTLDGTVMGTPAYMSPEQARGEVKAIDARTDVYAIGAILYELLAFSPPHQGGSMYDLLLAVAEGVVEPPSSRAPGRHIPHDLEAIVLKALAARRSQRYQSVGELQADLVAHLDGRLVRVASYNPLQVTWKWALRHKGAAGVLLTALLAISAFAGHRQYRLGKDRATLAAQIADKRAALARLDGPAAVAAARAAVAAAPERVRTKRAAPPPELQRAVSARIQTLQGVVDACAQLLALAPADPAARSQRLRALTAMAELAALSDDFAVADLALRQASQLELSEADASTVAAAQTAVDRARKQRLEVHRERIGIRLQQARAGGLARGQELQDAIVELATYRERQTVELLSARLDAVTAVLRTAARGALLPVALPTAEERAAGWIVIERFEPLLDRWLGAYDDLAALPTLTAADQKAVRLALSRVAHRDARVGRRVARRKAEQVLAERQANAIGDRERHLDEVTLIAGVLAHVGDPEGAVDALARYLWAEWEVTAAVPAGHAILRLSASDPRGEEAILRMVGLGGENPLQKWGTAGLFWPRVRSSYRPDEALATDTPTTPNGEGLEARCLKRLEAGDAEGAIELATAAVAQKPSVLAYRVRGAARHQLRRYDEAISDFTRALEIDPRDVKSLVGRGASQHERKNHAAALADYARALEIQPADLTALVNRGLLRIDMGEPALASADFSEAIAADARSASAFLGRGIARRKTGDIKGAIADLDQAIAIDPQRWDAYSSRGNARLRVRDFAGAIDDYTTALRLNPKAAEVYGNRATAHQLAGNFAAAVKDFTRTIEGGAGDARTWSDRGRSRRYAGDLEGAIRDHDQALQLDPRCVHALLNRAEARRMQGQMAEAEADIEAARKIAPKDPLVFFYRGKLLAAQKRYAEAVEAFGGAIALEPEAAENYTERALNLVRLGRDQEALKDYATAIRLAPAQAAEAYSGRSVIHYKRRDLRAARTDLDRSIALHPTSTALRGRAIVRRETGDPDGAIADFTAAVQLNPKDAISFIGRGGIHASKGNHKGAIEDYARAIRVAPRNADAWHNRGYSRLQLKQHALAIVDLGKALEINPKYLAAWVHRAMAYEGAGDRDKALAHHQQATRVAPGSWIAWANTGLLLSRMGRVPEAVTALRRAHDLAPAANKPGLARHIKSVEDRR